MKHIRLRLHYSIFAFLLLTLVTASCEKERALKPSNQDDNYLLNFDNPNDPIDHAIYQFYTSTKIPCFYNDTVTLKKTDGTVDASQHFVRLSLSYAPFAYSKVAVILPKNRELIPSVLDFLKTEVVPKIPSDIFTPSFLLVDSFWIESAPRASLVSADGWDSYHGFNTVAIQLRNVNNMSAEETKVYAASILAGIASKKITTNPTQQAKLQKDFYSVSRDLTQPIINSDIYGMFLLFMEFQFPNGIPDAETLGFIHYVRMLFSFDGVTYDLMTSPTEEDDLRMLLTAALTYTPQAFNEAYNNNAVLSTKFSALRNMLTETGFKLPD